MIFSTQSTNDIIGYGEFVQKMRFSITYAHRRQRKIEHFHAAGRNFFGFNIEYFNALHRLLRLHYVTRERLSRRGYVREKCRILAAAVSNHISNADLWRHKSSIRNDAISQLPRTKTIRKPPLAEAQTALEKQTIKYGKERFSIWRMEFLTPCNVACGSVMTWH